MTTVKKKFGIGSLRHKLKHSSNIKMRTEQTYFEMGNDNSGCVAMWPKRKKSKTTDLNDDVGKWDLLPEVILHDIYSRLGRKDRINASSTCHTWRQSLYHPKFWENVTFEIKKDNLEKAHYLRTTVAHIVTNATVNFDSLSSPCVTEFLLLLQHFDINDKLNSLILEPSHCHIESPQKILDLSNDTNSPIWFTDSNTPILSLLLKLCCRRPLEKLSLGLNEELLEHIPRYLQILALNRPEKVNVLGLASVKDDPCNYVICNCNPNIFTPFRNLQIMSIDYDILSNSLLESLQGAKDLQRLVIHVHGIWEDHPGTTEEAWETFKVHHPRCLVRVSLIHAYDEVCHMVPTILKHNMPLSHLKVLFCENVNLHILDTLSTSYRDTLQSVMWVDSFNNDRYGKSWNLVKSTGNHNETDPLIIMAWLCKKLEEVTFIGYKYREEDLVAIARLRHDSLKKLEMAECDLLSSIYSNVMDCSKEISTLLRKPWAPLQKSELHPVILNPVDGDSDEYIFPHLLADIS